VCTSGLDSPYCFLEIFPQRSSSHYVLQADCDAWVETMIQLDEEEREHLTAMALELVCFPMCAFACVQQHTCSVHLQTWFSSDDPGAAARGCSEMKGGCCRLVCVAQAC